MSFQNKPRNGVIVTLLFIVNNRISRNIIRSTLHKSTVLIWNITILVEWLCVLLQAVNSYVLYGVSRCVIQCCRAPGGVFIRDADRVLFNVSPLMGTRPAHELGFLTCVFPNLCLIRWDQAGATDSRPHRVLSININVYSPVCSGTK